MKKVFGLSLLTLALFGSASAAKITVWSSFDSVPAELAWLKQQAADFAKRTGNTVDIVVVPFGTIKDKFIQSAPKGQGPDLIVTQPHDRLGDYTAAGVVEPMDRYVVSRSDLDKSAVKAFTYRGKLFGLPMSAEAVAVVYNKKLVPNGPASTWNAFVKQAQDLTGNGRFGYLEDLTNAYMNFGFISSCGGYVFKDNNGTLNVKDLGVGNAGALKAMQALNDLRYKHNVVPEGVTGDAAKSAFLDGRLAMFLTGPWDMGDIKKAGIDYGIALPPSPCGTKFSPFSGVQGILMNAYSKNKAPAAAFAKFLVASDAQVSYNKAGGRIPVSLAARTKLKSDPVVTGFGKAIAASIPMPNVPEMGAVWGPWSNAVAQSASRANPDLQKIFDAATKEINGNIK